MEVVTIKPEGWDAEVQDDAERVLTEALDKMRKDGCRGVAVAFVTRDRSVCVYRSKSSAWHTVIGAVATLMHNMLADNGK